MQQNNDHDREGRPEDHSFAAERPDHGDRGASLVEYALLVALIAIIALVAVQFLGNETSRSFSDSAESVRAAIP